MVHLVRNNVEVIVRGERHELRTVLSAQSVPRWVGVDGAKVEQLRAAHAAITELARESIDVQRAVSKGWRSIHAEPVRPEDVHRLAPGRLIRRVYTR